MGGCQCRDLFLFPLSLSLSLSLSLCRALPSAVSQRLPALSMQWLFSCSLLFLFPTSSVQTCPVKCMGAGPDQNCIISKTFWDRLSKFSPAAYMFDHFCTFFCNWSSTAKDPIPTPGLSVPQLPVPLLLGASSTWSARHAKPCLVPWRVCSLEASDFCLIYHLFIIDLYRFTWFPCVALPISLHLL